MADDNQKMTKKTTQATAKHYWGKNAHLANGGSSSGSNKKSSSTGKKVAAGVGIGLATAAVTKGVKKSAKKTNGKTIVAVMLSFVLAIMLGAGTCFLLGKNDQFTLNGSDEVTLQLGQTYKDEGVKIVEFGMDFSNKAVVETNLSKNENGEYYAEYADKFYIAYTVKTIKFGFVYGVQKIRFVTFEGSSEGGE